MQKKQIKQFYTYMMIVALALSISSCAHKSGHHDKDRMSNEHYSNRDDNVERRERKVGGHTKVKMCKEAGVFFVPIVVNGLNLDFIFDTGASNISISAAEATVMERQGKITNNDVVGQAKFLDANGDISVGTVILLRTVQIGEITLENIEATVVDNIEAPLILGQTALAKFGKVTIDYNNNTIEFN